METKNKTYMGNKGDSVVISPGADLFYLVNAKSPNDMVDMFFDCPREARKYAEKHELIVVDKFEE